MSPHGWGARGAAHLAVLATTTIDGGQARRHGRWPRCDRVDYRGYAGASTHVAHPLVDGVWIGGALPLDDLTKEIDAVVSLYRVGTQQVPAHVVSHAVRLIDTVAEDNPNVELVIDAAARTVLRLRDQGKQVYLHCVAAHSRTPTVAARVAVLEGHGLDDALEGVVNALPSARHSGG